MRLNLFNRNIFAIGVLALLVCVAPAGADGMDSVRGMAGDLGITEDQAIGGTQALLDVAKGNLGEADFSSLLDGAGLGDVMTGDRKDTKAKVKASAAGAKDKLKARAGGVSEGGGIAALAGNADLVKQFSDLGLDTGMMEEFVGSLLDAVGGGGAGSGLLSPKTELLRKGLGIL